MFTINDANFVLVFEKNIQGFSIKLRNSCHDSLPTPPFSRCIEMREGDKKHFETLTNKMTYQYAIIHSLMNKSSVEYFIYIKKYFNSLTFGKFIKTGGSVFFDLSFQKKKTKKKHFFFL